MISYSICLSDFTAAAAAGAAKSLQLCLSLCDPIDGSPLVGEKQQGFGNRGKGPGDKVCEQPLKGGEEQEPDSKVQEGMQPCKAAL